MVRHAGRWIPTIDDVVAALGTDGGAVQITDFPIDTAQFAADGDSIGWGAAHDVVWQRTQELRETMLASPASRIAYFGGGPEIPLAIAFGAYIGEHHEIDLYEMHDGGTWSWNSTGDVLALETFGLPQDRQLTSGPATLRIPSLPTFSETK